MRQLFREVGKFVRTQTRKSPEKPGRFTKRVDEFLERHPNVTIHYTPTYSSWLNQVEIWFSKIERDVIARGVFTSVPDLARKIMKYIRAGNESPRPIKWTYTDYARRIRTC